MISRLKKLFERGLALSFENLFNRFVPEWIFRFSVGDVLELDLPQMCQSWAAVESADFNVKCIMDATERTELRTFTWNAVPVETTLNDFGYAIARAGDDQPILGGVWAGTESFIEANLGFRVMLEDNQAWLYCAYVDENTRGLGLYKRLLSFVGNDLTSRGFERLLVVIQPWNRASMGVHRRFLRNKVGRIIVLRVFRLSMVWCTGRVSKNRRLTTKQTSNPILLRIV
jgi:GNAT superfamily N-acetyltransferase